ncbi:hypothetical protein BDW62DRAFT_96110 [Aspergillus aurantiobrunneus]
MLKHRAETWNWGKAAKKWRLTRPGTRNIQDSTGRGERVYLLLGSRAVTTIFAIAVSRSSRDSIAPDMLAACSRSTGNFCVCAVCSQHPVRSTKKGAGGRHCLERLLLTAFFVYCCSFCWPHLLFLLASRKAPETPASLDAFVLSPTLVLLAVCSSFLLSCAVVSACTLHERQVQQNGCTGQTSVSTFPQLLDTGHISPPRFFENRTTAFFFSLLARRAYIPSQNPRDRVRFLIPAMDR